MLANAAMFGIEGDTPDDQAQEAWKKLNKIKKSQFALKYAIDETGWVPPGYILDGLRWLAPGGIPDAEAVDWPSRTCRRCPRSGGCSRWLTLWNT